MKTYDGCPKKIGARMETIIVPYRQHLAHALPVGKQYWTMCATHTDTEGNLLPGSELHQMIEVGIITPDQFHGVDIDADIIAANTVGIPGANWHLGDFHRTMIAAKNEGEFDPGVVNCDHLRMPGSGGAEYVSRCLAFLSDQSDLIFVSNLILNPPRNNSLCTPEEYLEELWEQPPFRYAMSTGWQHDDVLYVYGGTGTESRTVLGTMVFWKK